MRKLNVFVPALVLFSLLRLSLSAQAYTPDTNMERLLEMKTIVIRLSSSLTLRETLLSQREQDWTVREQILNDFKLDLTKKEDDLKQREDLIKPIEKIYEDLNTSLTKALKVNKVYKTALLVTVAVIIVEGIVIWVK